ncbi:TPA: hypothetical protein SMQ30_000294 [Proteus mirabilis]|nr:hypothetical protein [Proteus mirabilis]
MADSDKSLPALSSLPATVILPLSGLLSLFLPVAVIDRFCPAFKVLP